RQRDYTVTATRLHRNGDAKSAYRQRLETENMQPVDNQHIIKTAHNCDFSSQEMTLLKKIDSQTTICKILS
uniref:hypothetical protein n=1 Tax=Prevotella sp. TaxID=59823 RepID=UPI003FF01DC9